MKTKYNMWREAIKYFNLNTGKEITRQSYFANVKRLGTFPLDMRDMYRLLLQNAGYIQTVARGKYLVVKQIPDVSITLMRDFVSQESPIAWFKYSAGLENFLEARRIAKEENDRSRPI